MTNSPNPPDDTATIAKGLAAFATVLLLGPVGLGAATLPWFAAWFAGSVAVCLFIAAISALLIAAFFIDGRLPAAFFNAIELLRYPLLDGDIEGLAMAWLGMAFNPQIAVCVIPLGTGVGAVVRLLFEDSKNSGLARLSARKSRPSPMSRVARRGAERAPSHVADRTLLGVSWRTGKPVHISDAQLNHHMLAVGTTGAGKTTTVLNLVESYTARGLPVLFLDGKGDIEMGRQIKAFAEAQGRKAYLFHHETDGDRDRDDACSYNPFVSRDYSALADMVVTLHEWTEPYYEVLARGFMQCVFKVAVEIGEPLDLLSVEKLMSVSAMRLAVRKHRKRISDPDALMAEIQDQEAAEKAGIEGLRGLIRNLGRSSLAYLFDSRSDRSVLQLARARKEGAVVYFALPALTFPALSKAIGKLVINDARLSLRKSVPWLIVFDEISTFVGEQLLHLANQGRGFGARLVLSGQSFSDIERSVLTGGQAFKTQILASINTLVVHQLNAPDDAELAAQYSGTFQKIEVTAQVIEQTATGAGSARSTREFYLSPDELKDLGIGEAYVISKKSRRREKIWARKSMISNMMPTVGTDPAARKSEPPASP